MASLKAHFTSVSKGHLLEWTEIGGKRVRANPVTLTVTR